MDSTVTKGDNVNDLTLSLASKALVTNYISYFQKKTRKNSHFEISKSISLVAVFYEKIRNMLELHEDHLLRRNATKRILIRRLSLNPKGENEAENIIRELAWSRYLQPSDITSSTSQKTQKVIDTYQAFKILLAKNSSKSDRGYIQMFISDLEATEIDETISDSYSQIENNKLYFFYHTLKEKIILKNLDGEIKDTFFYVACEQAYSKNDLATIRAHLFFLKWGNIQSQNALDLETLSKKFLNEAKQIDLTISSNHSLLLYRFARRHTAPYKILTELIESNPTNFQHILTNKELLIEKIHELCQLKYASIHEKIKATAFRSIVYIFLTKMIFVLLLEFPLTKIIYDQIDYFPIFINTIFPPVLMGAIVLLIATPNADNTKLIQSRIIDILDIDKTFETTPTLIKDNLIKKNNFRNLFFIICYLFLFSFTFSFLYIILDKIGFNIISKSIFLFFLCVVTFFSFRLRQAAREYTLVKEDHPVGHVIDLFFLPILSIGKILSNQLSKINIIILFFDLIIEVPFKYIIEMVDDWLKFVRARKDEII